MQKNQSSQNDSSFEDYEKHVAENSGDYQVTQNKYENIAAKVLCVLAAIVLWFYVVITDTSTDERIFAGVNVAIRNTDKIEELGFSVISGYDCTVDITVKGSKTAINRLSVDDISAYIDVKEISSAGEYTLEINSSLPSGISVGGQSANYISVYIDKRATISVPVKVNDPSMTIESNYMLGTPEPSFETVNVSGAAEELEKIECAAVSFDLGKVTKTLTATGKLVLMDKNGSVISNPYVKLQTTEVTVKFPVYTYKELPLTVAYKYGYYNDSNVKITINPSTIRVKGDPSDLDKLEAIQLTQLDEKKITGDTSQSVAIVLPDGILNAGSAASATVTVEHKGTATREIEITSLSINNPNNLAYTLDSNSINVTFRGTSALLSLLNSNNVSATINLGNLNNATGKVSVPVTINIKNDIAGSVYEIGEYKMVVTIG